MAESTELTRQRAYVLEWRWRQLGTPRCAHRTRIQELTHLGLALGDWLCLDCGLTWWQDAPLPAPRGTGG